MSRMKDLQQDLQAYEADELSYDSKIELFQELLNTGVYVDLSTHYTETVREMLRTGQIQNW
jgi:hypothetical protein